MGDLPWWRYEIYIIVVIILAHLLQLILPRIGGRSPLIHWNTGFNSIWLSQKLSDCLPGFRRDWIYITYPSCLSNRPFFKQINVRLPAIPETKLTTDRHGDAQFEHCSVLLCWRILFKRSQLCHLYRPLGTPWHARTSWEGGVCGWRRAAEGAGRGDSAVPQALWPLRVTISLCLWSTLAHIQNCIGVSQILDEAPWCHHRAFSVA